MAHARRKFVDVYKSDKSPLANEALQRIAGLYAIEATIRGRTPRQGWRFARSRARRCSPI
jgi:hypothetical protein